jgi:hypothetical protein
VSKKILTGAIIGDNWWPLLILNKKIVCVKCSPFWCRLAIRYEFGFNFWSLLKRENKSVIYFKIKAVYHEKYFSKSVILNFSFEHQHTQMNSQCQDDKKEIYDKYNWSSCTECLFLSFIILFYGRTGIGITQSELVK